jgi:hypothetical protein
MSTTNDQATIDSVARVGQIIAGAMIAAAVVFIGVSIVVDPMGSPRPAAGAIDFREMITWIAVAFAAILLPMSVIVPGLIARQNRQKIAAGKWMPPSGQNTGISPLSPETFHSDSGKLAVVYQTQSILGAALIEGPTFFATIAYMLGKNPIALGLACLLLVAHIVRVPTRLRVSSWIDGQQELLIQERQAAV